MVRGNIAWLTGSDVRRQAISHDSFLTPMVLMVQNDRKGIANIYYIIKQLLTYISVGMESYLTVGQYDIYCSITVYVHLNISK